MYTFGQCLVLFHSFTETESETEFAMEFAVPVIVSISFALCLSTGSVVNTTLMYYM